jgi:pyruvate dehydrogenase E2 component (dihydrolipoamide acetyltransferase)
MTGRLEGQTIKLAGSIGIGLAIAVPGGLAAPIAKDADKKTVVEIAHDSRALAEKARNNQLTPEDLEGGCITISNLGSLGIDSFIPIVVPGQCSILGIGRIKDVCVPDDHNIIVRRVMNMTLSVDHKVANGAYAAQFLDFVKKTLEEPANFG